MYAIFKNIRSLLQGLIWIDIMYNCNVTDDIFNNQTVCDGMAHFIECKQARIFKRTVVLNFFQ